MDLYHEATLGKLTRGCALGGGGGGDGSVAIPFPPPGSHH